MGLPRRGKESLSLVLEQVVADDGVEAFVPVEIGDAERCPQSQSQLIQSTRWRWDVHRDRSTHDEALDEVAVNVDCPISAERDLVADGGLPTGCGAGDDDEKSGLVALDR